MQRRTIRPRSDVVEERRANDAAPARHLVGSGALWFGLFGAPAAWAVHALAATSINSFGCIPPLDANARIHTQPRGTVWMILLILTAILLMTAAAALITAVHSWLADRKPSEESELEAGEGRARFMAMAGILLGAIFSFLLVMNAIALFMAPECWAV